MSSKNAELVKKVARKMGAKIKEAIPDRDLYYIIYKKKKLLVEKKFFVNLSPIYGARTTKCKDITHYLLKDYGVSVPKSVFFYPKSTKFNDISNKLKNLKTPLIIKQQCGSNSKDLFPFINDKKIAKAIIQKELRAGRDLVVQTMVFGREYRILVLDKHVIGALEMIPPRVFGNGKDTVKKLIIAKQKTTHNKTKFDDTLEDILKSQSYKLSSIPEKGQEIRIKQSSSLSEGGETVNVTRDIHKDFISLSRKISVACGKDLAGIDLICEDITKSLKNQKWFVIEVNGMPDLTIHYTPSYGEPEDVVKKIIQYIFSKKI